MLSKFKRYLKEKDNSIYDNTIPKNQMMKLINKHIRKVGNFGTATLALVDIDDFHTLLEMHSEAICLAVVRRITKRIAALLPEQTYISHTHLDGILIFIPNENMITKIEKLCKKILESVRTSFEEEELKDIHITASIGVCTYPQSGTTVKELMGNLDLATFVSKRSGGNKVTSYYASLSDNERDHMRYYEEIKTAIQRKEFILYYQPIIDFEKQELFGAEALMRWNHPTKGVLPPQDFIQLMEQTGDIHWVGEWGIDRMIKFQQAMLAKYPDLQLTFSLNLCLKQLLNPNLAKTLIDIAMQLNAKPSRIMLEITDFMVYEKMKVIEANITRLKAYGFRIAVDGFPLEPQSVLAIQKCPVDVIKLGRVFLKDITNNFSQQKLLVTLLDYCRKNKKMVICEGIETKELLKYVKNQNVSFGSGFYFARPLDIPSFHKYVENKEWIKQLSIEE